MIVTVKLRVIQVVVKQVINMVKKMFYYKMLLKVPNKTTLT